MPEYSRVEVSTEDKHLWRKIFVKDVLSSYLAADTLVHNWLLSLPAPRGNMYKDLVAQQHHSLIAELRNLGVQVGMASSDEGEQRIERLIFGICPWQFHALAFSNHMIILAFRLVVLPGLLLCFSILTSHPPGGLPLLPRML